MLLSLFYLSFQTVSVPEVRCFQTAYHPVLPVVLLHSPPQPWASAGTSVLEDASALQASIFTREGVWKEMIVLAFIADAHTSQGTKYNRDATPGEEGVFSCQLFIVYPFSPFMCNFFCLYLDSVCSSGQWQCTGEKCAAECALMGGLQVTTFDKKRYSLQGSDCSFLAVEVSHV